MKITPVKFNNAYMTVKTFINEHVNILIDLSVNLKLYVVMANFCRRQNLGIFQCFVTILLEQLHVRSISSSWL